MVEGLLERVSIAKEIKESVPLQPLSNVRHQPPNGIADTICKIPDYTKREWKKSKAMLVINLVYHVTVHY